MTTDLPHRRKTTSLAARLVALAALLLWGLLPLGAQTTAPAPPAPPAPPVPQTALAPPSPQAGTQSLLSTADSVFQDMSRLTGLPIKSPLKKQVVSRAEIRKYLTETFYSETTPAERHAQEAALKAFGLVTADFDFENFVVTLYTEQAAGVYDPRLKTMLIADWVTPDMQRMVLAHELTHALQDQNFDLERFLHARRDDDDASNARQAVAEGYATAAMLQSLLGASDLASLPSLAPLMNMAVNSQMQEFPEFSKAPFCFRYQALFPYLQGMNLMQRGLKEGGWKSLARFFEQPPEATKDFFEPDYYFDHKPLPSVSLPKPTPLATVAGLEEVADNTMGELGYYCLVGQLLSEEEAKKISPSWLGDRYIVYENQAATRYPLVACTRWASADAALEFFRDYHTILAHRYPELTVDRRSANDLFVGSTAAGAVVILRRGDECAWAEALPADKLDAMIDYLSGLR